MTFAACGDPRFYQSHNMATPEAEKVSQTLARNPGISAQCERTSSTNDVEPEDY